MIQFWLRIAYYFPCFPGQAKHPLRETTAGFCVVHYYRSRKDEYPYKRFSCPNARYEKIPHVGNLELQLPHTFLARVVPFFHTLSISTRKTMFSEYLSYSLIKNQHKKIPLASHRLR